MAPKRTDGPVDEDKNGPNTEKISGQRARPRRAEAKELPPQRVQNGAGGSVRPTPDDIQHQGSPSAQGGAGADQKLGEKGPRRVQTGSDQDGGRGRSLQPTPQFQAYLDGRKAEIEANKTRGAQASSPRRVETGPDQDGGPGPSPEPTRAQHTQPKIEPKEQLPAGNEQGSPVAEQGIRPGAKENVPKQFQQVANDKVSTTPPAEPEKEAGKPEDQERPKLPDPSGKNPEKQPLITAENPSKSEVRAANHFASLGHEVELRDPVGTRAGGLTSDLVVDGVNWDVYTPRTGNPDSIVSAVASKGSQVPGGGVVIDLSESSVTSDQLSSIEARVRGTGSRVGKIVILE